MGCEHGNSVRTYLDSIDTSNPDNYVGGSNAKRVDSKCILTRGPNTMSVDSKCILIHLGHEYGVVVPATWLDRLDMIHAVRREGYGNSSPYRYAKPEKTYVVNIFDLLPEKPDEEQKRKAVSERKQKLLAELEALEKEEKSLDN